VILISLLLLLAAASPDAFADNFERGLGSAWAASQQIDGRLDVVPGQGGKVLRARTQARRERVPKAALIARPAKLAAGATVRVTFDVMVPEGAPLNSIHLVDLECASCGEGGNPGIRLYLRHGRLRIDRSKIGQFPTWADNDATSLRHGRWHRIELEIRAGFGDSGRARVQLDGATVLTGLGDTIFRPKGGATAGADRVQIGLTASSNPGSAIAYFDNVRVTISR
jgi:hypothetical protein